MHLSFCCKHEIIINYQLFIENLLCVKYCFKWCWYSCHHSVHWFGESAKWQINRLYLSKCYEKGMLRKGRKVTAWKVRLWGRNFYLVEVGMGKDKSVWIRIFSGACTKLAREILLCMYNTYTWGNG